MSGIIGGRYSHPVTVFGISLLEIFAGGYRCLFDVITFVYVLIYFQSEFASGSRHELP